MISEKQAIKELTLCIGCQAKSKGIEQIYLLIDYWYQVDDICDEIMYGCVLGVKK